MFSKFHWGHGIALFYLLFVATIIAVLFASFGVDRSLVADDYYAKDLAYQGQYDRSKNAITAREGKLEIDVLSESQSLNVKIASDAPLKGKIHFYRPSDESQDFTLDLNEDITSISTAKLLKGNWLLKVEWTEGKTSYYQEEKIYIS